MARSLSLSTALAAAVLLVGCGGGGKHSSGGSVETGRVIDLSGVAIAGATVRYYDASGSLLGTGTIAADGRLPTPVPSTAARFSVDASAFSDGLGNSKYYSTFSYNRQYYDETAHCYAPLPQVGSTAGFSDDIFFFTRAFSPPPPPVTGCIGTP